jgi:rhamnose transport system permease protein
MRSPFRAAVLARWSLLRELGAAMAFALLLLLLAASAPEFFDPANLRDVAIANAPVLIVSIGVTIVLLTGQVDISVGSLFAVCSVAFGLLVRSGLPPVAALLPVVAIGALLGSINGWLVARLALPSVVVTLATMVIWRDALRWATQGAWVQGLPSSFQWFGLSQRGGEWLIVIVSVFVVAVSSFVLRSVGAGRAVYAAGSDAEAARLSGLRPDRIVFTTFALLGAMTALAAVLNAIRFADVQSNAGVGLELKALAAAVVGGTIITGGRGTVIGTVAGVALLGTLGTALTFLGVSPFWEKAAQGAIILVAAALDSAAGATKRTAARAA